MHVVFKRAVETLEDTKVDSDLSDISCPLLILQPKLYGVHVVGVPAKVTAKV